MGYYILLFVLVSFFLQQNTALAAKKSYVVYLGGHAQSYNENILEEESMRVTQSHYELLGEILGDKNEAQDAIFYSYTRYINGFAAILEEDTALKISKYPGVVSVFPNRGYKLHTTRSWQFLGLERDGMIPTNSLWTQAKFGEGTIIANLDTGVWPESESFRDEGFGPIPSKWRGICQTDNLDSPFSCNRKLIGARYFNKGYEAALGILLNSTFQTPRDLDGHGSHTLSTAAGRFVQNVSIYGYGNGTAKGGSPHARVASYKVCWPPINGNECYDADILAAYDAAIHDGVDVLSISLGGPPVDYFTDGLAIGSFHAVKHGITVVCSAGNSGPQPGSVSNLPPWIFTVAASTMDREFPAYVLFGNMRLKGESLSSTSLSGCKLYPMISSINAQAANRSAHDAELCFLGSLDPEKVRGKIVACLRGVNARVEKGEVVLQAGGVGMVLANDYTTGNELIADAHVLPATHITYSDGLILFSYLNSTQSAVGFITKPATQLNTKPAPFMAAFSSQGPNTITPDILKPDITAPGVSVIAAYTRASAPTSLAFDKRRVSYNSVSGTSMACPHISGVIGLLKSLHPNWSPAAIKSAIMTSATTMDNVGENILNSSFVTANPFSYGSGHVNPNGAMDPGLVYDLTITDYLNFICAIGYNSTQFAMFETNPYKCPSKPLKFEDLNYPSITITNFTSSVRVSRTVKNVGQPGTYTARVVSPTGVRVTVKPKFLKFENVGEEKKFKIKFNKINNGTIMSDYVFGSLTWSDGKHYVRSPLVVKING
ncbi:hypothetical protein LUZ60_017076 [Juncus effusus]|nr:hypothetical protein LUZ60_017076 [Juncus effusus]